MITAITLVAKVAGLLKIDNNSVDIARFRVYDCINYAHRFLLQTLPENQIVEGKKTVTGDLSAAVGSYQWPTDYIRVLRLWVSYSKPLNYREAERGDVGPESQLSLDARATIMAPRYSTEVERGFTISPKPTINVAAGLRLRYIYLLPAVTSTQNSLFDDRWADIISFLAVSYCAKIESHDLQLSATMQDAAQKAIAMMIEGGQ
jgi:hypothetical protein